MANIQITSSNFLFLKELKNNNNRDWFNANKERYIHEQANLIRFADALLLKMNQHDDIETQSGKKCLHRIYRDTRFSKIKIPYKTNWSGSFSRATKKLRGGYYFHIEKGNSYVGGGFWAPNPADLKRIRDEIAMDASELKKIIKQKNFVSHFGKLAGEQVKTVPRGYAATDPNIDLLRFKQFIVIRKFTDKEVLSDSFLKEVNDTFRSMRPFFDFMSDVLTTDMNGISIV
jgi:uncharacterized protein (TIGR02453 family)